MIVTERIPFGIIKAKLKPEDKISIISCNACAKRCETGGEEVANKLAERLKQEGFNIADINIVGVVCDITQIQKLNIAGDVILVLACAAGEYSVKKVFPDKKIIMTADTVGLAAWDEQMNIILVKKFEK